MLMAPWCYSLRWLWLSSPLNVTSSPTGLTLRQHQQATLLNGLHQTQTTSPTLVCVQDIPANCYHVTITWHVLLRPL